MKKKVDITFRKVTVSDVEVLQKISLETFVDTYAQFNDAANFQQHLDKAFNIQQLQKELRDPNCFYFFAEIHWEVKGYLKLNIGNAQTEDTFSEGIEIERIYVLPLEKGKGIGRKLIEFSLDLGKKLQKKILWLGVWEKNPQAIAFYKKVGFLQHGTHTFVLGDDPQTDYVMKIEI